MSKKRKRYKTHILKSEFCKKYGITISEFNKILIDKGFLEYSTISINPINGKKKEGLRPGKNNKVNSYNGISLVENYIGTGQQGTYQYHEMYFKKVFNIE
jgi:hypothetical protein